uniref:Ig-like domain-containing protein n=2 Tax=Monodelphis domestica TaxID=13616 RepID=H9H723_MONDO
MEYESEWREICQRRPHCRILREGAYWRDVAKVILTALPSAPNLFSLSPCLNSGVEDAPVAVGCLAKDFLPDSINFSWTYQNQSAVSHTDLKIFPSQMSGPTYTATSQVILPALDVLQDSYLVCKASHLNSNKQVQVSLPDTTSSSPNVTVYIPPRDAFSNSGLRKSKLICQVTDFRPREIKLTWLREGRPVSSGFSTGQVLPDGSGTYFLQSSLTINESDWLSQSTFTCRVDHLNAQFQKNVSSSCAISTDSPIEAFAIPPSFASIFVTKSAKLTCVVTNLPTYDSLSISWTRKDGQLLKTKVKVSSSHPNGTFTAEGEATVCAEEWNSGEAFKCIVTHSDHPVPLKKEIFKPQEVDLHAPSVYLLPPNPEELSLRESATVTCMMKDFSPPDVFVQWMHKGQPIPSEKYVTSSPHQDPQKGGRYFSYSILTVSEAQWNSGDPFTCVVAHEALPLSSTERTVDKSTGKPTLVNVSLVLADTTNTCY